MSAPIITIADPRAADFGVRFSDAAGPLSVAVTEILPLVENGQVRMPIDSVFPLDKTADAQRHSENGHLRGKIIVKVDD